LANVLKIKNGVAILAKQRNIPCSIYIAIVLAILSKVTIKKNALFHVFSSLATKTVFDWSNICKIE
jgi:hypothetical protein